MPGKVLVVRPLPSTSTGPSVREMILGSEGRLGVITEATVQVHRIPEERLILGYLFPSWEAGLVAMQEISPVTRIPRSRAFPIPGRRRSPLPPARSPADSISSLVSKGLMKALQRRG